MSENPTNPAPGTVPPKPPEAAKVQPKKETVRINLPPKPTAAPTIKIPAPAAPPPAAKPVAAAAPAPAAAAAAAPAAAPAAGAPAAPRPVAAAPAGRPGLAPRAPAAARGVTGVDLGLAVVAAVISLVAFVRVLMLSQ